MKFLDRFKHTIVAISGGFDPVHIGHIRYIQAAARLGKELVVILNTDDFLMHKKGYVFMPFGDRKEILRSIKCVSAVYDCIDTDDSVCKTLAIIKPDIFAKGGDRRLSNIPEVGTCQKYNIKLVFGVGGSDKPQSSSWLVERIIEKCRRDKNFRRRYDIR